MVETTNFTDKRASFEPGATVALGTGETLRLVERFTRLDIDTLLYQYTVDDPATFTAAFTAAIPMTRSADPIFEYACHEGNYGMTKHAARRPRGRCQPQPAVDGSLERPPRRDHVFARPRDEETGLCGSWFGV